MDPDPGSPTDLRTAREVDEHPDSVPPEVALKVLSEMASALFPSGLPELAQLTWKPTTTPPGLPQASSSAAVAGGRDVAEEARLQAAEVRFRTLVEQIPAITFMAVLGDGSNEIYVSPYIETILGFTQEEWLSNPFLWYSQLHPDDRDLLIQEFARGCRTGGPFRAECRLSAKDGQIVWVRGEARLIKDSLGRPSFLQGVVFDITESRKAQEAVLRQAVSRTQRRYRDLVQQMDAIFWEAEAGSGRFFFVSDGAERILGFPPSAWLEDPEFWIQRVRSDDRDRVSKEWRAALAEGKNTELEFRAVTADDAVVWLRNRIHFPRAEAADARPMGVMLDITDRKRSEEELARSLADAQRAREEAEAANRSKDEFLATLSHELRTPVNALLGWSSLIEEGILGEDSLGRAVRAIKSNARMQSQVIDDLLDVSRIVSGKLRLDIERVDLVGVIEDAFDTVELAARAKQIGLSTRIDTPEEVVVLGDRDRLRQVLSNLLTNAVKFTPEGGRVNVRLEKAGGRARIDVTDTGQGIDPAMLPRMFDRFSQADGSMTRSHGGLGLGLAIVRDLTELHGGRVRADSAGKGKGATFTVELPLDSGSALHGERPDE